MNHAEPDGLSTTAVRAVASVTILHVPSSGEGQRPARLDGHPNFGGVSQASNEGNWDLERHAARPYFVTRNRACIRLAELPAAPALAVRAADSVPRSVGVVNGGTIPYRPRALYRNETTSSTGRNERP